MARLASLAILLPIALAACGGGEAPAPDPALAARQADALQRARQVVQQLGGDLKARLQAALQEGGPEAGLRVCKDEAQQITAEAQQDGVAAGRRSLRMRNQANGAPAWVDAWLQQQGERKVEGVGPFTGTDGGAARLLVPIGTDSICLNCHGPAADLAPGVAKLLQQHYPGDRATGYAAGDLRGAIWAEVRY
jgi:hypothetical protein